MITMGYIADPTSPDTLGTVDVSLGGILTFRGSYALVFDHDHEPCPDYNISAHNI